MCEIRELLAYNYHRTTFLSINRSFHIFQKQKLGLKQRAFPKKLSVYIQGICDIQNISYFVNSRKIAEQYENIHSAKLKNKYQMLFLQKTNQTYKINYIFLPLKSSKYFKKIYTTFKGNLE